MRTTVLLVAIALGVTSLAGNNTAPASAVNLGTQGATRFSSVYTALTKCGSGMTKKEEREAEKNGQDIPARCKGPGGYDVYIYYSACASIFSITKGEETSSLAMQTVNWKQKNVEWRLANGKPFAVIMRTYQYSGNDLCTTDGKVTGESLVVKGLKGYEQIDGEVKVKGTPNPNLKAREIADKGYAKPKP